MQRVSGPCICDDAHGGCRQFPVLNEDVHWPDASVLNRAEKRNFGLATTGVTYLDVSGRANREQWAGVISAMLLHR